MGNQELDACNSPDAKDRLIKLKQIKILIKRRIDMAAKKAASFCNVGGCQNRRRGKDCQYADAHGPPGPRCSEHRAYECKSAAPGYFMPYPVVQSIQGYPPMYQQQACQGYQQQEYRGYLPQVYHHGYHLGYQYSYQPYNPFYK